MAAPRFVVERPRRVEAGWYLLSAVFHVFFLGFLVWVSTHKPRESRVTHLVLLTEPDHIPREHSMRYADLVGTGVTTATERRDALGGVGPVSIAAAGVGAPALGVRMPQTPPRPASIGVPGASMGVPGAIVVGTRRPIGPAYGDGTMWQTPFEVIVQEGATWGPMEAELAVLVAEMLDSVIVDSMIRLGIPSWVFNAGGYQWGVDSKFIHLGPVKIPTVLLALLPIPATGNYEQAQQARWLADVRDQIMRQAQRMDDLETFKGYIKQLEERKRRERDEERCRRGVVAGRDSVISSGRN